jgi:hypothetical protein
MLENRGQKCGDGVLPPRHEGTGYRGRIDQKSETRMQKDGHEFSPPRHQDTKAPRGQEKSEFICQRPEDGSWVGAAANPCPSALTLVASVRQRTRGSLLPVINLRNLPDLWMSESSASDSVKWGGLHRVRVRVYWARDIGERAQAGDGVPWPSRAVAGARTEGRSVRTREAGGISVRSGGAGLLSGRHALHVLRGWSPVQLRLYDGEGEHQPSPCRWVPSRVHTNRRPSPPQRHKVTKGVEPHAAACGAERGVGRAPLVAGRGHGGSGADGTCVCPPAARGALQDMSCAGPVPAPTVTLLHASN